MKSETPIPARMLHLKLDERGYPIPFFAPIVEGKPSFRFMDQRKQERAINEKLCHVCGTKLLKNAYYFISGPMGYKNRISSDAAMHKECAEFTMQVCPHLFFEKSSRKEDTSPASYLVPDKPSELFVIYADKYKTIVDPQTKILMVRYSPVKADRYIYVNGCLERFI